MHVVLLRLTEDEHMYNSMQDHGCTISTKSMVIFCTFRPGRQAARPPHCGVLQGEMQFPLCKEMHVNGEKILSNAFVAINIFIWEQRRAIVHRWLVLSSHHLSCRGRRLQLKVDVASELNPVRLVVLHRRPPLVLELLQQLPRLADVLDLR